MSSVENMKKELFEAHRDLNEARMENTDQRRQLLLLRIKIEALETGKRPVQRNLCETYFKMEVKKLTEKMSKLEKELATTKTELKVTKKRLKHANQKLKEKETDVAEVPAKVIVMDECDNAFVDSLSINLRDAQQELAQKEKSMNNMLFANYKLRLEKSEELEAMQKQLDEANKVSELLKNEMARIREEDRKREDHCDYIVYTRERQIKEIMLDNRRDMIEKNAEIQRLEQIIKEREDLLERIYIQNGWPREQVVEEDGNDYQVEDFIDVEN